MDAKKSSLCFLIIFALLKSGQAQSVSTLMSGRAAGLAYASSTLKDEWSLFNNVGGLSKVNHQSTAFACEARPGLTGANRMAALFLSPLRVGVFGIGLFRFGDDLYSEQIISAGYANQFGIASLGLKVNFVQYRSETSGVRNALSLNFGGITQITPGFIVGAYIVNLNQPRISGQEKLPTKLVAGLSFKPSDHVLLAAEIEKDLDYDPTIKGGIEYQINKKLIARTGFNLHPNTIFSGIGFVIRKLAIDYAWQITTFLGSAHQVSASYRLGKIKTQAVK